MIAFATGSMGGLEKKTPLYKEYWMKKFLIALAALCEAGSLFAARETVDGIECHFGSCL